ncbi:MAG TPA: hypothetical protein VGB15_14230 [Longimicrobium sp.]|jgi:hypothetical protein
MPTRSIPPRLLLLGPHVWVCALEGNTCELGGEAVGHLSVLNAGE